MAWEDKAFEAAEESLTAGFKIFSFAVAYVKGAPVIQISIDKVTDPLGSPTIAECEQFSHVYDVKLTAMATEGEMPENYAIEVSSPGAERELSLPDDLERFKEHPMTVQFTDSEGKLRRSVVNVVEAGEKAATFKIANVKLNRKNGTFKKKRPVEPFELVYSTIKQVNLHLDF